MPLQQKFFWGLWHPMASSPTVLRRGSEEYKRIKNDKWFDRLDHEEIVIFCPDEKNPDSEWFDSPLIVTFLEATSLMNRKTRFASKTDDGSNVVLTVEQGPRTIPWEQFLLLV